MQEEVFHIKGQRGKINRIWINDEEIDPAPRQKLRNHSPEGFNWGYAGSGPSQTALAICLHIFQNEQIALSFYQMFKDHYVSSWQGDCFEETLSIKTTIMRIAKGDPGFSKN